MRAEAIWLRLHVNWDETTWLADLPWPVRACWPILLGHMKLNGRGGRCPAPSMRRLAAAHDIPIECLESLIAAAVAAHALVVSDDSWHIPSWSVEHGSESTDRVRAHRQRNNQPAVCNVTREDETGRNDCNVTHVAPYESAAGDTDVTPVTLHSLPLRESASASASASRDISRIRGVRGECAKGDVTVCNVTDSPDGEGAVAPAATKAAKRVRPSFQPPEAEEVAAYFRELAAVEEFSPHFDRAAALSHGRAFFDYFRSNGWKVSGKAPMKDWQAAARGWLRREVARKTPQRARSPSTESAKEIAERRIANLGIGGTK